MADIRPGANGSDSAALVKVGSRLFFKADANGRNAELWVHVP